MRLLKTLHTRTNRDQGDTEPADKMPTHAGTTRQRGLQPVVLGFVAQLLTAFCRKHIIVVRVHRFPPFLPSSVRYDETD